jgi:hypothetical protein
LVVFCDGTLGLESKALVAALVEFVFESMTVCVTVAYELQALSQPLFSIVILARKEYSRMTSVKF